MQELDEAWQRRQDVDVSSKCAWNLPVAARRHSQKEDQPKKEAKADIKAPTAEEQP